MNFIISVRGRNVYCIMEEYKSLIYRPFRVMFIFSQLDITKYAKLVVLRKKAHMNMGL